MPKVNIDPQSVKLQKEEKSLQLKNRIKRQYNPSDINIAKLFLAIREHRTGNPQLNKISEIEGLLTQVQNINDIDLNDIGNTPLHVAVSKKHPDIVEFLLNVPGIDPNIQNNQGDTSLHIAVSEDDEELVRLLLSKKAEMNIKNKDGKTPLDIARSNTQPNKEKIISTLEEHLNKSSNQVERLSESLFIIFSEAKQRKQERPFAGGDVQKSVSNRIFSSTQFLIY